MNLTLKRLFTSTERKILKNIQSVQVQKIINKPKIFSGLKIETKIENIENTFQEFFDDDIKNKIVDYTNNRINETMCRLQTVEIYNKSIDKYTSEKVTDKMELHSLFGLIYFRGVNLHLTDYLTLFSPDI